VVGVVKSKRKQKAARKQPNKKTTIIFENENKPTKTQAKRLGQSCGNVTDDRPAPRPNRPSPTSVDADGLRASCPTGMGMGARLARLPRARH
jgi:hypothetical protein